MGDSQYSKWTHDQLVSKIKELETMNHNHQNNNTTTSSSDQQGESSTSAATTRQTTQKGKPPRKEREFDWSKHSIRPIALKIAYLGWDYYGLASQESETVPTIEAKLFDALITTKLIPSRKACHFSRCGRTDKGVSSFGQVVSLYVRSSLPIGAAGTVARWDDDTFSRETRAADEIRTSVGMNQQRKKRQREQSDDLNIIPDDEESPMQDVVVESKDSSCDASQSGTPIPANFTELPYVAILNRILPPEIRVLGWSPTSPDFDARFNCTFRRYRYYFPSEGLDLARMKEAATQFLGVDKDFRNFCKVDPTKNITNYRRTILAASVFPLNPNEPTSGGVVPSVTSSHSSQPVTLKAPSDFCVFEVKGTAFLWHQVRCMMAVLLLIGRGLEYPGIIGTLLDPNAHPENAGRPIYRFAPEHPLVLVECGYPPNLLNWRVDGNENSDFVPLSASKEADTLKRLWTGLWSLWRGYAIKATQVRCLLDAVGQDGGSQQQSGLERVFESVGESIQEEFTGEGGGYGGKGGKAYIRLMERPRCDSNEERQSKKKKQQIT